MADRGPQIPLGPNIVGDGLEVLENTEDKYPIYKSTLESQRDNYSDFLARPVKVGQINWTPADLSPNVVVLADSRLVYLQNAIIAPKVKNFLYVSGEVEYRFQFTGQPFSYGSLVIAIEPFPFNGTPHLGTTLATPGVVRQLQMPHVIVDPSSACELSVCCPIVAPTGLWGLQTTGQTSTHRVLYSVLNVLKQSLSTPPENVQVSIFMSIKNAKLFSPTLQSKSEKTAKGWASAGLDKFTSTVSLVKDVPVIGPFATAASSVSKGFSDAFKAFGFSTPTINDYEGVMVLSGPNYTSTEGRTVHRKLTTFLENELSPTCEAMGLGSATDMNILDVIQREGLVRKVSMSTTAVAGVILDRFEVRPNMGFDFPATGFMEISPLCFVSSMFRYWGGNLEYTFEVVASTFARGTILIVYDPSPNPSTATTPTLDSAITANMGTIVNISGRSKTKITVPWSQAYPLALVALPTNAALSGTAGYSNGSFYIYVINKLINNGSVDPITINVYVAGTTTTLFAFPSMFAPNTGGASGSSKPMALQSEGVDDHVYRRVAGEKFDNLKQLANKMAPLVKVREGGTGPLTVGRYLTCELPYASPMVYLNYNPASDPFLGSAATFNALRWTFQTWCEVPFVGKTGGTKYSVLQPPQSTVVNSISTVLYTDSSAINLQGVSPSPNVKFLTTSSNSTVNGDIFYNGIINGCNLAVKYSPLQMTLDFVMPAFNNLYFTPNKSMTIENVGSASLSLQVLGAANTDPIDISILAGAAEDWAVGFWVGVPSLKYV